MQVHTPLVFFPPDSEEYIEFKFILEQEGEVFFNYYKQKINSSFNDGYNEFKIILLSEIIKFHKIRINIKGQLLGIGLEQNPFDCYLINLPLIDYNKYRCALDYQIYISSQK